MTSSTGIWTALEPGKEPRSNIIETCVLLTHSDTFRRKHAKKNGVLFSCPHRLVSNLWR